MVYGTLYLKTDDINFVNIAKITQCHIGYDTNLTIKAVVQTLWTNADISIHRIGGEKVFLRLREEHGKSYQAIGRVIDVNIQADGITTIRIANLQESASVKTTTPTRYAEPTNQTDETIDEIVSNINLLFSDK